MFTRNTPSLQVPGSTTESSDFNHKPYVKTPSDYESQTQDVTAGPFHKRWRQIHMKRSLIFAVIGFIAIILIITLPVVLTKKSHQSDNAFNSPSNAAAAGVPSSSHDGSPINSYPNHNAPLPPVVAPPILPPPNFGDPVTGAGLDPIQGRAVF